MNYLHLLRALLEPLRVISDLCRNESQTTNNYRIMKKQVQATRRTLLGVIADEAELLKARCEPRRAALTSVDINAIRYTYDWLGRYIDGLTVGLVDENTVIEIDEPTE